MMKCMLERLGEPPLDPEKFHADWTDFRKRNELPVKSFTMSCRPGYEHDINDGNGSLIYDWTTLRFDDHGNMHVDKYDIPISEMDFTSVKDVVSDDRRMMEHFMAFREWLLESGFLVGRIRIMVLEPHRCLSMHTDDTYRVHVPIVTHRHCGMILDGKTCHLDAGGVWLVNTKREHTAYNCSSVTRVHLMACVDFET